MRVLAGILFAAEVIPNEIAALALIVLLVVLAPWTQVSPAEAISGFASPATVTVLAMFILSEGVRRTGVVRIIGRKLRQFTGDSESRHLIATLGISGPLAGVVNNTPVVAVLIPALVDLARENRISPSKLLIPLSYGSMLGGMLTLVGTASTILASDLSARLLDHPIGMFEFTPLGLLVLVVGTGYLLTVGRRLLPARIRPESDLTAKFRMRAYLNRMRVRAGSPLVGKTIEEGLRDLEIDMDILQIVRDGATYIGPFTDQRIDAQDVLTIRADEETRHVFARQMQLEALPAVAVTDDAFIDENHTLLECTIPSDSPLEQETIISSNFRQRYHGTVLAIRRGDTVIRDRVEDSRLREGDSLLVQTTREQEKVLHVISDLVVTRATPAARQTDEEDGTNRRDKMPMALGILGAVIAIAATGLYPIVITALAGVVLMVVTGCLKTEEAYAAVSWNIIFLLGHRHAENGRCPVSRRAGDGRGRRALSGAHSRVVLSADGAVGQRDWQQCECHHYVARCRGRGDEHRSQSLFVCVGYHVCRQHGLHDARRLSDEFDGVHAGRLSLCRLRARRGAAPVATRHCNHARHCAHLGGVDSVGATAPGAGRARRSATGLFGDLSSFSATGILSFLG